MDLESVRDAYYEASKKASEIARQLSFAGIALIWIFKQEKGGISDLPGVLLLPAALFVIALALDLIQYFLASGIWSLYARHLESQGIAEDAEVDAPVWFNWPTLFCFWVKLVFVILGYWLMLHYILATLAK